MFISKVSIVEKFPKTLYNHYEDPYIKLKPSKRLHPSRISSKLLSASGETPLNP